MKGNRALVALTVLAATAMLSPSAAALGPGSTVLVSRPGGDVLPSGAVNDSEFAGHGGVSDTGRYVVFSSRSDGLLAAPSSFQQVFRLDRFTDQILLVSATPSGAPGGADSGSATISADGSVVAYQSRADDLVPVATNPSDDVFVRNLAAAGTTSELVSRAAGAGGAPANGQSIAPLISADGKRVLFSSIATNLPEDASNVRSAFVRSLDGAKSTVLVSRANNYGTATNTQSAAGSAISADGSVALFVTSQAFGDPHVTDDNAVEDVYARRLTLGQTWLVSRASAAAGLVGDGPSFGGALSADGTIAAFTSASSNLIAPTGDVNGVLDVYKRTGIFDDASGTTSLVSRTPSLATQAGNGSSLNAAISASGSVVAFSSRASDLLTGPDTNGAPDAFARSGSTNKLLTRDPGGTPALGAYKYDDAAPGLSGDGTIGVFGSQADGLSISDDDDFRGIYAAGVSGGPVQHLSRPPDLPGVFEGGVSYASAGLQSVSADGRYVAFTSASDSLSTEDDDRFANGFVRDLFAGTTTLVSRADSGQPANGNTSGMLISADGTHVAFSSYATNLSPDDADSQYDTFVHDLRTRTTVLASRADGAAGAKADDESGSGGIDADGSRIAFISGATNLGSGTDPDLDVFVRDVVAATTTLASRADGVAGDQANGDARDASISADGSRVAFSTVADNLGNGDSDATSDVHVRDMAAGRTLLASRADGAAGAKGDGPSSAARISGGGGHVVFETSASNLGDGGPAGKDVYVRDLGTATTRLASRADGPAGLAAAGSDFYPSISDDGTRVLFARFTGDLTGEAPAAAPQAFLRDLATSRTVLVSRGDGLAGSPLPVRNSASPSAISGSGRCVAFTGDPPSGFATPEFRTSDFLQVYLRTVDGECAPAPPPGPPGTIAKDSAAPVLSKVSLLRSTFAVDRRSTPATAAARRGAPYGTQVRFTLSEAASVRIVIARERAGARKGKLCVKRTAKLRTARRCTRLVTAGMLVRAKRPNGASKVAFSGRIGRKALKAGRHRATLVATDAAGNRSRARTLRFLIKHR